MLQQTRVKTVIPYYGRFLNHFTDIHQLAKADLNTVLKVWEGLGYYARARNLHSAARVVVEDYGGVVPDDFDTFRKLPGVGDYIASAVMSIAFGKPYAVVDGNVKRVLARITKCELPVNMAAGHDYFSEIAQRLLAKRNPGSHNQGIMELGALVCTPKQPRCADCPVKRLCRAFLENEVGLFPKKAPRSRVPLFHIAAGIVCKGKRILITRRKPEGLLGGLWEFPGGKVKKGEGAEAACVREIKEETNLKVCVEEHLVRVRHAYTHFKIEMDAFRCNHVEGRIRLSGPEDFRWIRLRDLTKYPFPKANHKVIEILKEKMKNFS